MRAAALALAAGLLAAAALAEPPKTESLEGTHWKVRENSFKAKVFFWRYDYVAFLDGEFRSASFRAKGFVPGAFTSSKTGESVTWTASLASADNGKVVWEGRRTGTRMEGTWTWRKADGATKAMGWTAKQTHGR